MWKPVIGATAVLALAGSSLVYAQQRFNSPPGSGGPEFRRGWQQNPDDMAAMADARIAAMKAGLRLTPDQDKNWPPFEQALRDLAKLRAERAAAMRQEHQRPDERGERGQRDGRDARDSGDANPFERLQRRADAMTRFSAALKNMADTGAPLYQSLDEGQRHRFMILARLLRPHPMMWGGMRGDHRSWFRHHDEGRNGEFDHGREDWRRDRDDGRRGIDREPHDL